MKKTYTCDVCREIIYNLSSVNLFGVHFSDQKKFTLGAHGCTAGTHICISCARQLKEHLNTPAIEKIMRNLNG